MNEFNIQSSWVESNDNCHVVTFTHISELGTISEVTDILKQDIDFVENIDYTIEQQACIPPVTIARYPSPPGMFVSTYCIRIQTNEKYTLFKLQYYDN